jgi:hypothetical protein
MVHYGLPGVIWLMIGLVVVAGRIQYALETDWPVGAGGASAMRAKIARVFVRQDARAGRARNPG